MRAWARRALAEDRARHDLTTLALVPPESRGRALAVVRRPGVLAGGPVAADVFRAMDTALEVRLLRRDGARVSAGDAVVEARGSLRSLLSAERTALNFLTHLSGVATLTRRFVAAAPGVAVMETRKTIPGLRDLQKYAVRMGGGRNHRRDLASAALIKENHLAFFHGPRGREELIARVRRMKRGGRLVEMECRNRAEALWALDAGADIVLIDNVPPRRLGSFVGWVRAECARRAVPPPELEVSGGVSLEAMPILARSGVDRISIGRLTHSAPALDISLDVEVL